MTPDAVSREHVHAVVREQAQLGGVGTSARRPDGPAKVRGEFTYAGDLAAEGMLVGVTLRSPHPHARITRIDTAAARALPGVHAVLTADDVPGDLHFGLTLRDEPVLADGVVRYAGEPVAVVAAVDAATAGRAARAVEVDYEPLPALTDPQLSLTAEPLHPDGNVYRHVSYRCGDPDARGVVTVENTYRIGMQDPAFLAPEAGLAWPTPDGGVAIDVATQWLHSDQQQIGWATGLPPEKVHVRLAGVGGAFGGREDVTLQTHACLLALATGRPVKFEYTREESFLAHRQRHPGTIWLRHSADASGRIVSVEGRVLLDGGAYASTSPVVITNTVTLLQGPYRVDNGRFEGWSVRTNNPSCGAMRGFGVPQAAFAHEAQLDALAAALGMDPVEVRLHNALQRGDVATYGQRFDAPTPVREVLEGVRAVPLPQGPARNAPGGVGRSAEGGTVRRGVGYAVTIKNLAFSEGHVDESTAEVSLCDGHATVHTACAEVGQGFVTVAEQVARTVLGASTVEVTQPDTLIASAGSTSASRQTMASGTAVHRACLAVRDRLLGRVAREHGLDAAELTVADGVVCAAGQPLTTVAEAAPGRTFRATEHFQHPDTHPLGSPEARMYVGYGFSAQRAVVDVDVELGLVSVVQIASCQDVGTVINPTQLLGQIEGGIVQGMGLALMEEVVVADGRITNPDFQDYLIPTIIDAPEIVSTYVTDPQPGMPHGWKGVGEPPLCTAVPVVAAAVRAATGLALPAVPIKPEHIALGLGTPPTVTWTTPRPADPTLIGTVVLADEEVEDALGTMAEEGASPGR
ncbi:xanthine dehydrogenase subunit D [Modestobacter versicolor]|uniref:Xanthine dehydrogenase subunit D n=1 Tax=Modestobacter versicolor TaxID=429133 RepID=A0A323V9U9_9ACTN|nr:xanthine dehydrogenase subunit D [Modestobacter versicolor]